MTTYLVTGGAGFIGSNYIHFLFQQYGQDIQVFNLDALTYCGRRENLSDYEKMDNYHFIHGDVCDEKLLQDLFDKNDIDYVVHFAAESHVDRSIEESMTFATTNVIGTLTLLNVVKKSWCMEPIHETNKRFYYVSTDEVYGSLHSEGYFTEDSPLHPRNPYSVSKAGADMMVKAFYETYQLPVLISRCSNNYGAYQYEEKLIPYCIQQILKGQKIPIYGDGLAVRDWLDVKDHCRAIQMILGRGCPGEVYNVGGHNERTTLEVVKTISEIMDKEYHVPLAGFSFVTDRKGHDRRYAIDPTKIQTELGWKPAISFEDGVRKTIRWYMNNKNFIDC